MADPPLDPFRICATCRNLEVVDQGREFEQIADSEFIVFRCKVLGTCTRDDYLMAPVLEELPPDPGSTCPFWEPWQ